MILYNFSPFWTGTLSKLMGHLNPSQGPNGEYDLKLAVKSRRNLQDAV